MSLQVVYEVDKASTVQVVEHLQACDAKFEPPLGVRVDIPSYGQKIVENARRFEAWSDGVLVGLVAAYFDNTEDGVAYITNVSVVAAWARRGIAATLLQQCIDHARHTGMRIVSLQVAAGNEAARQLYHAAGFRIIDPEASILTMRLKL
jgi:ribosomal protein S18 acetylase RimI-like enzyme